MYSRTIYDRTATYSAKKKKRKVNDKKYKINDRVRINSQNFSQKQYPSVNLSVKDWVETCKVV